MKKLFLIPMFALFCFTFTLGGAFAAEEYNFQSQWSSSHPLNKSLLEPWCKEMTEKSNGKVVVHFNALGALVKSDAVAGAVQTGSLDIGGIQMQNAVSMMPLSQLLGLPFLVQNAEEAGILYAKMFATFPEMKAEVDKNFHLLAMVGSDRYCFLATNGLIKKPEDLKGKRVLIWAPYQADEVKSWGGLPVQVISSETYMGLQRGLGEVAYVPVPAVRTSKLDEVAKNLTIIPSRTLPMIIAMNKDAWKSLPPEIEKNFTDSMTPMTEKFGKGLLEVTKNDLEAVKANGGTIYELSLEEQAAFKDAAAASNTAYWVDTLKRNGVKNPEEWIAKVEALAKETFKR